MTSPLNNTRKCISLRSSMSREHQPLRDADRKRLLADWEVYWPLLNRTGFPVGSLEYDLWFMRPACFVTVNAQRAGDLLYPSLRPLEREERASQHITDLVELLNSRTAQWDIPGAGHRVYVAENGDHVIYWSETPPLDVTP